MAQTDLFPEDRYIIDTSSLVDAQDEDQPAEVWKGIFKLINASKLKTAAAAYPEIERMTDAGKIPQYAFDRIKARKRTFCIPDEDLIVEAGRIVFQHSHIETWRDPKNPADPWIIAAARLKGYIVVTEERDTGPKKNKRIPWVCEKENVKWIRLRHLIQKEKLLVEK
jgi:predicted nucleic acid-binding protein